MRDVIADYYSSDQSGSALPYFAGNQYGSGWLRSLARFAFPMLKTVGRMAGNVAINTAGDLLENGKSLGESLRDNTLKEISRSGHRAKKRSAGPSSINRHPKRKKKHSRSTIFTK